VGFLSFGINRETVRSEISNPSFSNSPRMRGAPQIGLAEAIVLTNWRISERTRGRPDTFDCDNLHQYCLTALAEGAGSSPQRETNTLFQINAVPTLLEQN
jgi:hypothetical protein